MLKLTFSCYECGVLVSTDTMTCERCGARYAWRDTRMEDTKPGIPVLKEKGHAQIIGEVPARPASS